MVMQEMMEEPRNETVLDTDEVVIDMSDVQDQLHATCEELKVSLVEHAEELKRGFVGVRSAATTAAPSTTFKLEKNAVVQDERTGLKF